MEINLGNIAGVVRGLNPPLEQDNSTVKTYVLWAQPTAADPNIYKVLYYDTNLGTWVGFDDLLGVINTGLNNIMNEIGDMTALNTTDKSSIVNAINSILSGIGDFINDNTVATTTGYSSNKIEELIQNTLDTILGAGVSGSYNTLKKIEDIIEGLNITGVVKFSEPQSLSVAQKAQANNNIGSVSIVDLGDVTEDLTTTFDDILT